MSTPFLIRDKKGNDLLIRVYRNFTGPMYTWKPISHGRVKATPDHDSEAWRVKPQPGQSQSGLVCKAVGYDGTQFDVLHLFECFTAVCFNDSGTGYLYADGVTG